MGNVRLNRVIRARLGYFLGALVIAAGVYFISGLGWSLVAFGVATMAAFVWLYDVDEPQVPVRESQIRRRVGGDDW